MRVAGQIICGGGAVQLDPSRNYAIAFAGAAMQQSRQWQNQPETQPAVVDQYTYVAGARISNGLFQSDSITVQAVISSPGTPVDIGVISNGVAAFLGLDITVF